MAHARKVGNLRRLDFLVRTLLARAPLLLDFPDQHGFHFGPNFSAQRNIASIATDHLFDGVFAAPFFLRLGVLLPEQRHRLLILYGFSTGPQLFGLPTGSGGTHLDSMMLLEH